MLAFKLMRLMDDGTVRPLFINKGQGCPVGEWLPAECHPTPGFAVRQGWHACSLPAAPHLKLRPKSGPRVWCIVELGGHVDIKKVPVKQGSEWLLANQMRVVSILHGFWGKTMENSA